MKPECPFAKIFGGPMGLGEQLIVITLIVMLTVFVCDALSRLHEMAKQQRNTEKTHVTK